ncbi:MAG: hypothetical protein WBD61_10870 [Desulfobulbales bacterium]
MRKGFGQHYKNFTGTGIVISVSLFLMASLFILPGKVMADEGWGPGQDKWKFEVGGYFPAISTDMKIDVGDVSIDLENVLGLSENESVARLDGYWRFAKKHRLGFGYYGLRRDASHVFSDSVDIGGETWYAGAYVSTELDMDFFTLAYAYSFYQNEKWEIAGTIGAYWVRVQTTLALGAEITIPDPDLPPPATITLSASDRFVSETVEAPLPLIGLNFDYYITPKLMATFKGGYFQLSVDEFSGRILNLGAKLEYQFTKMFGLGLGYDSFNLNVKAEDAGDIAEIEYKYHGIQLYGVLRF